MDKFLLFMDYLCRSQWPRGLRHRFAAARLLRLWVRIPPREWMFVCCACCVLSGRGLCDELITRPEESYRLCCVIVCDLGTSWIRRPWTALGRSATGKKEGVSILQFNSSWLLSKHKDSNISKVRRTWFYPVAKITLSEGV